jgi:hypothetical protein
MPSAQEALTKLQSQIDDIERRKTALEQELRMARLRHDLIIRQMWQQILSAEPAAKKGSVKAGGPLVLLIEALREAPCSKPKDLARIVYGNAGHKEQNRVGVMLATLKARGKIDNSSGGWRLID